MPATGRAFVRYFTWRPVDMTAKPRSGAGRAATIPKSRKPTRSSQWSRKSWNIAMRWI